MIATITDKGIIVFDLYIQSTFPASRLAVGCYDGYENCLY